MEYAMLANAPPLSGYTTTLRRTDDEGNEAFIPLDLANRDYQAFLEWLDAGNKAPAGWSGPTNSSPKGPP